MNTSETTGGQKAPATATLGGSGLSVGLERELSELNAAVDAFAEAMKAKLAAKAKEGWTGWKSQAYDGMIVSQLLSKANLVEYDRKQAVDIANLSMMLWHQAKRSNVELSGAGTETSTESDASEIERLRALARDAYAAWDSDKDARVGKLLIAMLDEKFSEKYRPDLTPNRR